MTYIIYWGGVNCTFANAMRQATRLKPHANNEFINLIFTKMEKKKSNEELQTRREFFKKAAKGALPILAAVALAGAPNILKAAEEAPMGCKSGCYGTCAGSCSTSCRFTCSTACRGNCSTQCRSGCVYNTAGH